MASVASVVAGDAAVAGRELVAAFVNVADGAYVGVSIGGGDGVRQELPVVTLVRIMAAVAVLALDVGVHEVSPVAGIGDELAHGGNRAIVAAKTEGTESAQGVTGGAGPQVVPLGSVRDVTLLTSRVLRGGQVVAGVQDVTDVARRRCRPWRW